MDFLWLPHCTPKLLSGAHGFSEDISHPTWRMNCDGSVFWKDRSRHPLGLPGHTVQAQLTISTGVWSRQTSSEARTATMWWRGWDHFVEFSNNGCVYQPDKELLWWAGVSKVSLKVKRWGETECLLWFYFVEWEAETLLETGVFLTAPKGGLTEISYRTETSSMPLPPPPICSFSDPWGFLTAQEPKRKIKKGT